MSITYYQTAKSEAVNKGWLSQNQRELLTKELYTTKTLKKISVDERACLFAKMCQGGECEKGKNLKGGTYGQNNCDVRAKRSAQTFYDPKTTLRAASQTFYHSGQNGWSSSV